MRKSWGDIKDKLGDKEKKQREQKNIVKVLNKTRENKLNKEKWEKRRKRESEIREWGREKQQRFRQSMNQVEQIKENMWGTRKNNKEKREEGKGKCRHSCLATSSNKYCKKYWLKRR